MEDTVFVSDIKRVENYPDFDKLEHEIQHALQWFIVKNIEGDSTEVNDLSLIVSLICCVNNSKFYQRFHKT